MKWPTLILTLSFGLQVLSFRTDDSKCVPIPQCKTLNWMWRHRSDFPEKSTEEVENFIYSLGCGLDLCPKEIKIRSTRDRNPLIHRRKTPIRRKYQDNIQRACEPHLK